MNISPQFIIVDDDFDLLWQFTAYIKQVTIYARLEYLRKLEYRTRESSLEQLPPEILMYEYPPIVPEDDFAFDMKNLSQAFSKLTLMRRRILTLIFVEELSAPEVADKLGCSVDYVYLQKHRALKKLRNQLMEEDGDYGK